MDCLNVAKILPNSPRKIRGQIQVIFGPMFSGKSTELMRRVRRFQVAQYSCLVIKYAKDTRYSQTGMATHDIVDDLRPLCLQAFGNILNLVPLAESVVKLNAVCMQCFKEAAYTKRLGAEQEVEVIGGTDKYHAVCRACYGGLVACKENCDPQREETPPHVTSGKQPNQSAPRKLFASLHL
ncbi:thymidine kinase, cytosolic-like [Sinocyclocheilus anshuiensis]|uniref:thymidine kinase, cytosolic-like n=1 Tax=Sinocyclocheilus anshuiensis TaxID=1608454 RepID=UPI0007B8E98A|nr:PREDICTED: thymidine kinase, cytosolic-like [Sinocyclocheilus anshuiensis]